ncbi:PREDICTED: uncharacterized protein LOC108770036 [Trachymyrmex cornetzi]|uniref:uncharacterized protein LOC108770036 n=1 Tax=Trachymyrmex cornetzi TaxID=471704 RepID=UPI00084EF8E0|nr:PREDICTED: uncharacterized protein LOC108770036 [Trachymyrmex cornetzi]
MDWEQNFISIAKTKKKYTRWHTQIISEEENTDKGTRSRTEDEEEAEDQKTQVKKPEIVDVEMSTTEDEEPRNENHLQRKEESRERIIGTRDKYVVRKQHEVTLKARNHAVNSQESTPKLSEGRGNSKTGTSRAREESSVSRSEYTSEYRASENPVNTKRTILKRLYDLASNSHGITTWNTDETSSMLINPRGAMEAIPKTMEPMTLEMIEAQITRDMEHDIKEIRSYWERVRELRTTQVKLDQVKKANAKWEADRQMDQDSAELLREMLANVEDATYVHRMTNTLPIKIDGSDKTLGNLMVTVHIDDNMEEELKDKRILFNLEYVNESTRCHSIRMESQDHMEDVRNTVIQQKEQKVDE